MGQNSVQRQAGTYALFRIVLVCEAIVFLFAAILHTGAFGVPAIFAAMIVEGLCGVGCVISAYTVFTHRRSVLKIAIIVQILILAGVLLGFAALIRSAGLRTPLNLSLHGIMLLLILIGLSLLAIPATRKAFRSDHRLRPGEG